MRIAKCFPVSRTPQRLMTTGLVCALLLGTAGFRTEGDDPKESRSPVIGQQVYNFVLPNVNGEVVGLTDFSDRAAIVVFFMGTDCTVSDRYVPRMIDLQRRFDARGLQVIGIHSNDGVDRDLVATHSRELEVSFPVLIDADQRVADHLGASTTAQVFLLDQRYVVRYHGSIDSPGSSPTAKPERRDLEEALVQMLDDKGITVTSTKPIGSAITRTDRSAKFADVTYSKEVSRIIQSKCQACHRPGMIGPFPLMDYRDAANWSDMIKEVVLDRRMPPWHADPRYGEFSNDRRLTADELDTMVAWVDADSPEGDKADLPDPIEYVKGWQIGTPDLILELPEVVTVPADGVVPYLYFNVPTNFTEDRWITAAEVQPGNFEVVHHVIVTSVTPGSRQGGGVSNFVPGSVAQATPPGTARRLRAGSVLRFQMHYTPTGREQTDRTKIGLIFYKGDEPPKWPYRGDSLGNFRFRIPPGDPHFEVTSSFEVKEDMVFTQAMPHMHVRGTDYMYRAIYPDGTKEILLSVPNYDFNWQLTYRFTNPPLLPKGTIVEGIAHFDNSTLNPANPDPTDTVGWGRQTWHEMMFGWAQFLPVDNR